MSQVFVVRGGRPLAGECAVHGAKNAILPLLAAGLLCKGPITLHRCPDLHDVRNMLGILEALGCKTAREGGSVTVNAETASGHTMPEGLSKRLRSSIFMLGPVLSRFGEAVFTYPGGCEIGLRPIDLHLSSLRAMGAKIQEAGGHIHCSGKLRGAAIHLDYPSVGATENVLMAAVGAQGNTLLTNAAREPEVGDLAAFLNACGAEVRGAGTGTIEINGGKVLTGVDYTPMTDRIVAGTLLLAAPITRGEVYVRGAQAGDLQALLVKLKQMGCVVRVDAGGVLARGQGRPRAVRRVETNPHPSFPTDMQAQMMAALSTANGLSLVIENVFESRFAHAGELGRMGADIEVNGRVAVVRGVPRLHGARVASRDLRGGAALVLAALGAQGESVIDRIEYIDRGYAGLETLLGAYGADIRRENREG